MRDILNNLIPMVVFHNYSKDINKPFDYKVYTTSWMWYPLYPLPWKWQWGVVYFIQRILSIFFDVAKTNTYTPLWVRLSISRRLHSNKNRYNTQLKKGEVDYGKST